MQYIKENRKVLHWYEKAQQAAAIEYLNKHIEHNKKIGENLLTLYDLYVEEKDFESAVETLERAQIYINFINDSVKIKIYTHLADLYFKKGEYKKAYVKYREAHALDQHSEELYLKLGLLYIKSKHLAEAGKIFKFLVKKHKHNEYYQVMLAYFFCENGEHERCETILKELVELDRYNYPAQYYLGYYYYTIKDYKEALKQFVLVENEKEFRYQAAYYSGMIHFKKLAYHGATEFFVKALKLLDVENRESMEMRYDLAICYEHSKNYYKALEELRTIYRVDPEYKDVAEKLISDNYNSLGQNYLLDYNSFSKGEFDKFVRKLLANFNLKVVSHKHGGEDTTFIYRCEVDRVGERFKFLGNFIDYRKKETVAVIFCRSILIREENIKELLEKIDFKFRKGILFSSSKVSILAQKYASRHHLNTVIPTFLNSLIKQYG